MSTTLPTTFNDSVKERIKTIVGELIPEDVYNGIVSLAIQDFMKVDLPKLVKEELTIKYKELIKEEFTKPEWQTRWKDAGPLASDRVRNILIEAAPSILAGMMSFAANNVVNEYHNKMQQYS
jgi:negative regulator of sigma E activity